jgi:hypothetical protein
MNDKSTAELAAVEFAVENKRLEAALAAAEERAAKAEARAARLKEALRGCMEELEAAIHMLHREGIIRSPNLGGFRAALLEEKP